MGLFGGGYSPWRKLVLLAMPLLSLALWENVIGDAAYGYLAARSPCVHGYGHDGAVYDAIVVLGYELQRSKTQPIGPNLKGRLQQAINLVVQPNGPKKIVFSGGTDRPGMPSEALEMRRFVQAELARIDPQLRVQLAVEQASTSTRENAEFSLRLLEERGLDGAGWGPRVVVVTERFHQARALRVFERAEQERSARSGSIKSKKSGAYTFACFAPAAGEIGLPFREPSENRRWDAWRELAALALYTARGWI